MATQQHHPNPNNNRKPEEGASQARPGTTGAPTANQGTQPWQGAQSPQGSQPQTAQTLQGTQPMQGSQPTQGSQPMQGSQPAQGSLPMQGAQSPTRAHESSMGGQPEGTFASRVEKTAEQVKSTAIQRAESVRQRAESGLSDQRHQLAERIHRVGELFRTSERELSRDDEFVSHYLGVAGERVQRVATYVESADLSRIADDVRTFARARPALFVGGAFVAGLALGRFFRASSAGSSSGSPERRPLSGQGPYGLAMDDERNSPRGALP